MIMDKATSNLTTVNFQSNKEERLFSNETFFYPKCSLIFSHLTVSVMNVTYFQAKYIIKENYLAGQLITPRMRATLIDWLVDVQQQYHLFPETLHLCVAIIDMFLQVSYVANI